MLTDVVLLDAVGFVLPFTVALPYDSYLARLKGCGNALLDWCGNALPDWYGNALSGWRGNVLPDWCDALPAFRRGRGGCSGSVTAGLSLSTIPGTLYGLSTALHLHT